MSSTTLRSRGGGEELRAYIGPHAESFMPVWASMQARAAPRQPGVKRLRLKISFVVMAFFLGPCWFFYRKLWLWAWVLTGLIVLLAVLPIPGRVTAPLGILLAVFGRQAYIGHAQKQIAKLRGGAEFADLEVLRRAGGVSPVAGWVSSGLVIAISGAGRGPAGRGRRAQRRPPPGRHLSGLGRGRRRAPGGGDARWRSGRASL